MFKLATAIALACGVADNDKTFTCWDVYNNCVINRTLEPTQKDFDYCKDRYEVELKRIEKLQEEK